MIPTAITATPHPLDEMRALIHTAQADPCVDAFHRLWYATKTTWGMTRWRGLPTMKCPFDLHMYHELLIQIQPRLVIETGTAWAGSACYFADTLAMIGQGGRVLTIDVTRRTPTADHPGLIRLIGSSVDPAILDSVAWHVQQTQGPILVSLDSDHSATHVAAELRAYAPYVTPGSYLVVEDTNIAGHPVPGGEADGGPAKAVDAFLATHPEFVPDLLCERLLLTMMPQGWLRRIDHTESARVIP